MNIEKMREEFETWARSQCMQLKKDGVVTTYAYERTDLAWQAWQASRESLVIELPAENPLGSGPGDCEGGLPSFEQHCAAECNFILRDCREAIESAGVKVKP